MLGREICEKVTLDRHTGGSVMLNMDDGDTLCIGTLGTA